MAFPLEGNFYFEYQGQNIIWNWAVDYEDISSPMYKAYHHQTYKPKLSDIIIVDTKGFDRSEVRKALHQSILDQINPPQVESKTPWGSKVRV